MIRAILDGQPMQMSAADSTAEVLIEVKQVTQEHGTHMVCRFMFDSVDAHVVAAEQGAKLKRLWLRDADGGTVANLVNLDGTAEDLARQFHEAYEKLAPSFGYETREASAKPWEDVPEQNRNLMAATVARVFGLELSQ